MDAVTGALSYTGSYIARRLLADGEQVTTLSRRPDPAHPLSDRVAFARLQFSDPAALARDLVGATTLYNTYWIRFPRGDVTWDRVVRNTKVLLAAAREAGVRRVVHISVSNPSEESPLPYFRHKALVEREVRESGLRFVIVRPTLIFGVEDILVNNIAWALRRFPLFTVPPTGYRTQPVAAEDVADIAVEAGRGRDDVMLDAAGPETYTFAELARTVGAAVGGRARLIRSPASVALLLSRVVGRLRGDVMLTAEEMEGLRRDLLVSLEPPRGGRRLEDFLARHAGTVGARYASELARNWR